MSRTMTPEALRENYEHIWSTTDMRESEDYYARCLALATPRAGERLLDVACGGGYLLSDAERHGLVTTGVDIAEAALGRARELAPSSDLRRADAEALPFADGAFDIVTCLGSLEHFLRPDVALEEMRRVLAPGGRAVVVVPNQWFVYDVARGWLEGAGLSHGQESERYFSIDEARALVGRSLWITRIEGWSPPARLARATRPLRSGWARAAYRVYGWLRPRLPLAMSYVFVLVAARAPSDAPASVSPGTDAVIPGGWHPSEGAFARWTTGRAGVWLRLGSRVAALVRHSEPVGAPLPVSLVVERSPVARTEVPSETWSEVGAAVPAELRGTVQRVYVEVPRTWSPFAHGVREDVRDLGVSVQRIWSDP